MVYRYFSNAYREVRGREGLLFCFLGLPMGLLCLQVFLWVHVDNEELSFTRLACRLFVCVVLRVFDVGLPTPQTNFIIRALHASRMLFAKLCFGARGYMSTVTAFRFPYRPYVRDFPVNLGHFVSRGLSPTIRPLLQERGPFVEYRRRRVALGVLRLVYLHVPPLVGVASVGPIGLLQATCCVNSVTPRGAMRVRVDPRVCQVSRGLNRRKACRFLSMRLRSLFHVVSNSVPVENIQLFMRVGGFPRGYHFPKFFRGLLYVSSFRRSLL